MYFKQFLDERGGCASYVIAARRTHEAAVVDPGIETGPYEALLRERGFTALADGQLSIACARSEPPHGDPSACDRLQDKLVRRVVVTGQTWFSTVRHGERPWLRFNLVNLHTREEHIRRLVDLLGRTAWGLKLR
jgi:glutamate/tyrosine decarboxylase-like PLP-dependent enzyme